MLMVLLGALGVVLVGLIGVWLYFSNVETPKYTVVEADNAIEIRDYPPLVAAEVIRKGTREAAVRAGFSPLAGYIFAKEREGDKIAMTAPVTQSATDSEWVISFIMPSEYSLNTLPNPAENTVNLREIPGKRIAAIRFSGVADDTLLADKEAALRAWLKARNIEGGPATFAYYNDPFTPGFLRRNEVLIDVQSSP
jgi:hypothetical protein